MENNKNEVDLLEILIKSYLYLKKYFWVFIIALTVGLIFAFIKNQYMGREYESSMILSIKFNDSLLSVFSISNVIFDVQR